MFFSSRKSTFIVGADITEFLEMFSHSEEDISKHMLILHDIFNSVEDLPCPTVAAINGISVGGGLEFCLATDYRIMVPTAKIGLPEVKLEPSGRTATKSTQIWKFVQELCRISIGSSWSIYTSDQASQKGPDRGMPSGIAQSYVKAGSPHTVVTLETGVMQQHS